MNDLHLSVCDSMDINQVGYTYSHNSLPHKSLLDHVFVHNDILPLVSDYEVILDAVNLSDHLPLQFSLSVGIVTSPCMPSVQKHLPECRWDKCDLNSYCFTSGDLLSRIGHNFNCANELGLVAMLHAVLTLKSITAKLFTAY